MMEGNRYPNGAAQSISTYDEKVNVQRRLESTLRKNIDEQIKRLEGQIAELNATKERLTESGILDTRIDDIQRAMRF